MLFAGRIETTNNSETSVRKVTLVTWWSRLLASRPPKILYEPQITTPLLAGRLTIS